MTTCCKLALTLNFYNSDVPAELPMHHVQERICQASISLIQRKRFMQKNKTEQQKLPVDTFIKDGFSFADILISFKPEALQFLLGTINGRPNLQYYLHLIATMTITEASEDVRGIKVTTSTCQKMLPIKSLRELWGMERHQARNFLDKMEQLNLIKRTSDTVTSVMDVVSICGFHADGRWVSNPTYINKRS